MEETAIADLKADLKKYEDEIDAVNKKLAELDDSRSKLIRHGTRIEGIVVFLRGKLSEAQGPVKTEEVAAK